MGFVSRIFFTGIAGALFLLPAAYAQGNSYDKLVSQAQADLNAGNAAKALVESQQAIKAAPARWEAYVAAGGALQLEHQYDQAVANYSLAVEHAPDAKKSAVRALLQKVEAQQAGAQSSPQGAAASASSGTNGASSGPSYAETVQWIEIHLRDATVPGSKTTTAPDSCSPIFLRSGQCSPDHPGDTDIKDPDAYSIRIDDCDSLVITKTGGGEHLILYGFSDADTDAVSRGGDQGPMHLYQVDSSPGDNEIVTIPIASVASFSANSGDVVLKSAASGIRSETDYPSSTAEQIPYSNTQLDQVEFQHLMKHKSYYIEIPSGGSTDIISFSEPGTATEAPHMANALNHLVELCKKNPNQGDGPF